jgi:K+/H+ antiporter YhaU regulatory subunit KhtT
VVDTQIDSSGDNSKDLGTAVIREVGCGVVYTLEFEDTDEMLCQVGLDRKEAERLYAILGKMLKKQAPVQSLPPTPWNTLPPVPAWAKYANWHIPPMG